MTASAAVLRHTTATLAESGATVLDPGLRPLDPATTVAGRALTVRLAEGHNIWLHRAVDAASPGDVLVAGFAGPRTGALHGYWGEILASAALRRGIAGLVLDATVRDRAEQVALRFPVFSRGTCVRGTGKDDAVGGIGHPVVIGGTTVRTGDLVVGDGDGLVVVDGAAAEVVARRADERVAAERVVLARIAAGESTLDIYGFR